MQLANQNVVPSKTRLWAGRILSAIPILLLLFSGVMKLMKPAPVLQGFAHYGYPESLIVPIVAWVGLYLRDQRLGALVPTRR